MPRLKDMYNEKIVPEMLSEYKNKMAVPKLDKVIVNVGIGKVRDDEKTVKVITENLSAITGQKPAIRKAKKAVAGFKVREGDNVGLVVTLRGNKMYDFIDKLVNITLPRVRDFRGLDLKSFDKNGNYNIGIRESVYFPEISHESDTAHGLQINVVTTAKTKEESEKLLTAIGLPFKKAIVEEQKNG